MLCSQLFLQLRGTPIPVKPLAGKERDVIKFIILRKLGAIVAALIRPPCHFCRLRSLAQPVPLDVV